MLSRLKFYTAIVVCAISACIIFSNQPALSQNKINDVSSSYVTLPKDLQIKIGKKLFFEKKQGCATCHGMTGKGADRAKEVDLSRPTSWKSFKVASAINCQKKSVLEVYLL